MKTVRFQSVIDAAGQPEPHLLWMPAEKDKELQKAIKEQRVMTIHQSAVGTRADFGRVSYEKTAQGQVLIFPRTLAKFAGSKVVAIRYDLYADAPVPATAERLKADRPRVKKSANEKPAWSGLKIVDFPEPEAQSDEAPRPRRPAQKAKPARSAPAKPAPAPRAVTAEEGGGAAELAHIKKKVRQAMKELEQGRQVKAHEILAAIVK
jgi:hypothetical protein